MSVVAIKSKPWVDSYRSEDKNQYSNFQEAFATNMSKQGKVQKKPKQRSKKNIEMYIFTLNYTVYLVTPIIRSNGILKFKDSPKILIKMFYKLMSY